jgi:hypothetical protein
MLGLMSRRSETRDAAQNAASRTLAEARGSLDQLLAAVTAHLPEDLPPRMASLASEDFTLDFGEYRENM